jgi:hypothetical protein
MAVTSEYVAALRALLTGDADAFDEMSARLQERDGPASGDAMAALQAAALTLAARRRFASNYMTGDVVRFVGQVRIELRAAGVDIDPRTAEQVLLGVLGSPGAVQGLDDHAKALAVPALLVALTNPKELSGPQELDVLLTQAQRVVSHPRGHRGLAVPADVSEQGNS